MIKYSKLCIISESNCVSYSTVKYLDDSKMAKMCQVKAARPSLPLTA